MVQHGAVVWAGPGRGAGTAPAVGAEGAAERTSAGG